MVNFFPYGFITVGKKYYVLSRAPLATNKSFLLLSKETKIEVEDKSN